MKHKSTLLTIALASLMACGIFACGTTEGPAGPQGPQGETGQTGPQGSQGEKGDTGATGPQGESGPQGSQGPKGDTGATGPQGESGPKGDSGPQGTQGEKGETGSAGQDGKDGTAVLTGNANPTESQGNIGDTFINISTWEVFIKTSSGWISIGNIKGESGQQGQNGQPGKDGKSIAMGAADPVAEFGNEGDIWFNTTTWDVFAKNADGWTKIGNVRGGDGDTPEITIGTDGYWYVDGESTGVKATGENGTAPTVTIGEDGNWYVNGVSTGVKATGDEGHTPEVSINEEGYWEIDGVSTGVKAKGEDATAPTVTIGDDGFWYVNGVSTGVQATGDEGHTPEVDINDDGYWEIDGVSTGVRATGNTGNGIAKIEKVSYDEETRITTYKVTYTNGNSFTYYVKDGKDGEKGETGATGKSAYELYCAQFGYTGTEADWLQALADGTLVNRAKYTVTFDTDGGSEIASQQVTKWEKVSKPEDPTKEGYAFAGWMCGDEMWSFNGGIVTSDMTLTARWTKNYYTASFKFDGVVVETRNVVKGSVIEMPYHSTYYGFYSHNWVANDTTYSVLDNVTIASDTDITFTATVKHLSENYECVITEGMDGKKAKIEDYSGPVDIFELPRFAYVDNEFIEINELGYYVFNGNYSGHNYIKEIPNTYNTIAMSAFFCTFENSLYIPSSVTVIGEDAFRYAEKHMIAIEAEEIPVGWDYQWQANCPGVIKGVTSIEKGNIDKFEYTSYLTKQGGETEITKYNGSEKDVTIPRSIGRTVVTSIGNAAFYYNRSIESLSVPGTVKRLLPFSMRGMSSLTKLELNKGLEWVGEFALANLSSLKELDLPSTVKTLASYSFYDTGAVTYTTLESKPSGWSTNWGEPNCIVYGYDNYREKSEDGYVTMARVIRNGDEAGMLIKLDKEELGEHISDYVLPSSMSNGLDIEYMLCEATHTNYFEGTLTLPSKLKEIPSFGCAYTPNVTEFILPDTLETISSDAFNQCNSLEKIAIPESVNLIGEDAFFWCTELSDVTFEAYNKEIEIKSGVFTHCTSLTSILFPVSVKLTGEYIFSACSNLEYVKFRGFTDSSWNDKWNYNSDDTVISASIIETYSE